MDEPHSAEQIRRRLRIVRWVALADLVLLIALVASSLTGQREFVRVLGPAHGINFLLLIAVAATAALDGLWGWWFPAAILLTAGPLGAIVGERVIERRMASVGADPAGATMAAGAGARVPGTAAEPGRAAERSDERGGGGR